MFKKTASIKETSSLCKGSYRKTEKVGLGTPKSRTNNMEFEFPLKPQSSFKSVHDKKRVIKYNYNTTDDSNLISFLSWRVNKVSKMISNGQSYLNQMELHSKLSGVSRSPSLSKIHRKTVGKRKT
jgi:hypothetical protein